jgi:hypothetical protein
VGRGKETITVFLCPGIKPESQSKTMKILYGYPYFPAANTYGDVQKGVLTQLNRIRSAGYSIEPFCLSIDPPSLHMPFKTIDKKWKMHDRKLLAMYERLEEAVQGVDVFYNSSGIHLHPEFIEKLPCFTVFGCNDDPESSEYLSKPVASSYDLCLVGNIAELDTYKSWGAKHVEWQPMGLQPGMYDPTITYDNIINGQRRDIDLFMLIDKTMPSRKVRMESMDRAFPSAHFYGKGWERGYLPVGEDIEFLKKTKIGPNFHLSTGPINFRTFYLPANGVMQICDNKKHLGQIYKLGEEVVGFDTVEECIELCRYYLDHDEERRHIAAEGWKRAITDYNEIAVFEKFFIKNIEKYFTKLNRATDSAIVVNYKRRTKYSFVLKRLLYTPFMIFLRLKKVKFLRNIYKLIKRM